jgi:hypothetical protein
MKRSPRPTFIGIGGLKCATTWLSECLRAHPEVFVTTPKEVHFFDTASNQARGIDWYWQHFSGSEAYAAAGEIGATLLAEGPSAMHIRDTLGQIQVIITIRNPIDRFLSEYKHRIRGCELPKNRFRTLTLDTLQEATQRCPTLLNSGMYAERLREFSQVFGRDQMLVLLHDDIEANPSLWLRRLYSFLGVDANFCPSQLNRRISKGIVPRSVFLENLRQRVYGVAVARCPKFINLVRSYGLGDLYRRINSASEDKAIEIDPMVRNRLADIYQGDILATSTFLERDLSAWLRPTQAAAA